MTFDNVTDMRIGSKKVKEAWLNGKQVYPSKKRIMDSMVLWYDLKRQGATNESMAANPKLIDLSGNGHDATCYNFAWTEMSGIGGYDAKLFTEKIEGKVGYVQLIDSYSIHISKISNSSTTQNGSYWEIGKLAFRVILNVQGLQEGQDLFICQYNNDWYGKVQLFEGRNDVTLDFTGTDVMGNLTYWYATFYTTTPGDFDVTIKLEPLYPNALVSDGVDDYATVTDIGLNSMKTIFVNMYLTSENREDFRFVFSSREPSSENSVALVYKVNVTAYSYRNSGDTYIDGTLNTTLNAQDLLDVKHVATLTNENGNSFNNLDLFRDNINSNRWCNVALYSFIAFNRILSTDEIAWVKTNLIESEQ